MLKVKPQHRKQENREHVLYVQCEVCIVRAMYSTCKWDRIVRTVVQYVLWCHSDGRDGDGDDDNSSSYRRASDYGTEDNHSRSSSVHSDYDGSNASDAPPFDYDVNFSFQDGHHSDLFENLFQTLPVDANKYRSPGTTLSGVSGPLLFQPCDYPSAVPTLLPHVDDGLACITRRQCVAWH